MPLQEQIGEDLKQAMRAGETLTRDTLRMVLAALKNKRIDLGGELDEDQVRGVLANQVKSRKDSAEQYQSAGRPELAEKELAEVGIIQRYLPTQLSEEATRELVQGLISELAVSSKKDLGKLMKAVMAEHKGTVDGKTVQRLAAEILS